MRGEVRMEPLEMDTQNWLEETLALCTEPGWESRERLWIRERFEAVARSQNLSGRGMLDRLIFERLYGRPPEKSTEQLTIRYWRTGQHKPQSREQCLALGQALGLDTADTDVLLRGYYDSADRVFTAGDEEDPVYHWRRRYLEQLETQYLAIIHPLTLERRKIPWEKSGEYLRHCYVQEARQYVDTKNKLDETSHLNSANYVNEFQRLRFLRGEIPRKTMLRHLFLLSVPFVSRSVLDQGLETLGYLPLDAQHESRFGERTDLLVLRLLERYQQECAGRAPDCCHTWLRQTCRTLDAFLLRCGHPELRFLHFKTLDGEKKKARQETR